VVHKGLVRVVHKGLVRVARKLGHRILNGMSGCIYQTRQFSKLAQLDRPVRDNSYLFA